MTPASASRSMAALTFSSGVLCSSSFSCPTGSPNSMTMSVLPTMFINMPKSTKPSNMVTAAIRRPPTVEG